MSHLKHGTLLRYNAHTNKMETLEPVKGFSPMQGTARKGPMGTYGGQTHTGNGGGNGGQNAEGVQKMDNSLKELSERVKALEDAIRAHGLIASED